MAVTWQSIGTPSVASETQLLQNSGQRLSDALSRVSSSIQDIGTEKINKQAESNRKALGDKLTQLALNSDNINDFRAQGIDIGQAAGLNNEESQLAVQGAEDLRKSLTSLTPEQEAQTLSDIDGLKSHFEIRSKEINDIRKSQASVLNLDDQDRFFSAKDLPQQNELVNSIVSNIEDMEDRTDVESVIKDIKFGDGSEENPGTDYTDNEWRIALATVGNPDKYFNWYEGSILGLNDGVRKSTLKKNLLDILKENRNAKKLHENKKAELNTAYNQSVLDLQNALKDSINNRLSQDSETKKANLERAREYFSNSVNK